MDERVHEIREKLGHLFTMAFCMSCSIPKGPEGNSDRHNWNEVVDSFHALTFVLDDLGERIGSNGAWYIESRDASTDSEVQQ
jgi:hypothetical protein